MEKERNYVIDLLRIISMIMVVLLHILDRGGLLIYYSDFCVRYSNVWFIEIACYCAVNCYALISGYVGYGHKYKNTGIIKLWLEVVF